MPDLISLPAMPHGLQQPQILVFPHVEADATLQQRLVAIPVDHVRSAIFLQQKTYTLIVCTTDGLEFADRRARNGSLSRRRQEHAVLRSVRGPAVEHCHCLLLTPGSGRVERKSTNYHRNFRCTMLMLIAHHESAFLQQV